MSSETNKFAIVERYISVVRDFGMVELAKDAVLSIPEGDLDLLVQEVAQKIIAASQIKPLLSGMAKRELSLRDSFYLIVQDSDRQYSEDTPAQINAASAAEKQITAHVVKALSKDFVAVTKEDLTTAAVLFGIKRIHELATPKIIVVAKGEEKKAQEVEPFSKAAEMERTLAQLVSIRNKYPAELPPETQENVKQFILNVDTQIRNARAFLDAIQK